MNLLLKRLEGLFRKETPTQTIVGIVRTKASCRDPLADTTMGMSLQNEKEKVPQMKKRLKREVELDLATTLALVPVIGKEETRVDLLQLPQNYGRLGTVRGTVTSAEPVTRVSVLVFSHDERWYGQKPATCIDSAGNFDTEVAFGLDKPAKEGREYIVVAVVGADLPPYAVFDSLSDLPPGCKLSPPISVSRTDPDEPEILPEPLSINE